MTGTNRSVTICIPTYRRKDYLDELLQSLEKQQLAPERRIPFDVLIIDNDDEKSAQSSFEKYNARGMLTLRYVSEPRRGLSYVRNAALDASIWNSEFVCFLDDDQTVSEVWLDEMLRVQQETNADCVCGAIESILPPSPPAWAVKLGFFDKPSFKDGEVVLEASTANLMFRSGFLRRTGMRFDHRFRHTGGEDTFFFRIAHKNYGLKVIGAGRALAYEKVPPSRLTLAWNMKRALRAGGTLTLCERLITPSFALTAKRLGKGTAVFLYGAALVPCGLVRGKHVSIWGLTRMALGVGEITALMGYNYAEYGGQPKKKDGVL